MPRSTIGHLTHTLSSNTVWDVRVGRFWYDRTDESSTGDRTTPNRTDRITNVSSGNVPQMGGLKMGRITAKAVLNRYQAAWLGVDHQMRVGIEVERGEHRLPAVIPGGVRYVEGDQRILIEPRGSRRLPLQSLLDVRVSKTLAFAGAGRVELLFHVLNLLNDTASANPPTG